MAALIQYHALQPSVVTVISWLPGPPPELLRSATGQRGEKTEQRLSFQGQLVLTRGGR